ncbi:Sodium:dicarboxylate symporter-like protein 3 [Sarcoptes scabiei]|nr:Sodium:dicarboxylate symporter-like protein 3 [Sarcoptes scabiei]
MTIFLLSCFSIKFNRFIPSLYAHILTIQIFFHGILHQSIIKTDEAHATRSSRFLNEIAFGIYKNMMTFGTFLSVVLAISVGFTLKKNIPKWSSRELMYLNFLGEIFMRILKCMVLPLIATSLVYSLSSLDKFSSRKITFGTIVYYFGTTVVAILTGIILILVIRPGEKQIANSTKKSLQSIPSITTVDSILDLLRNLFPDNIAEATIHYYRTVLSCGEKNESACDPVKTITEWKISHVMESSTNILGVVMFSWLFGRIIPSISERETMICFFRGFNEAVMAMTQNFIQFTPIAVTFLTLAHILKIDDLNEFLKASGFYSITVLLGLLLHGFITLPIIYLMITRKNPFSFIQKLSPALFSSFGTGSSSATIPVTMQCLENLQIDENIVRFCIPIGATINMDGTALYEAVAALFIAQYRQKTLELVDLIIMSITATAASVGAAGIPQAGLVTMVIVLNAIGLDAEDITLIIISDWILDRFRTVINVLGDSFGTAIIGHWIAKYDKTIAENSIAI